MMSKYISILFILLSFSYLVFTVYFRSPYPQDHYYYICGEPIKVDSLTIIQKYSVNEGDSHGSGPYYFDRPRQPNTTLDTNWNYLFISNLKNNLNQSFYVKSVVLIDNISEIQDSIPFAFTLLNKKFKDNNERPLGWVSEGEYSVGEKYVNKKNHSRILIRNYYTIGPFEHSYKDELIIIRKLFISKRISFVLNTTIGRFIITPRKYRIIDYNGKVVKESIAA